MAPITFTDDFDFDLSRWNETGSAIASGGNLVIPLVANFDYSTLTFPSVDEADEGAWVGYDAKYGSLAGLSNTTVLLAKVGFPAVIEGPLADAKLQQFFIIGEAGTDHSRTLALNLSRGYTESEMGIPGLNPAGAYILQCVLDGVPSVQPYDFDPAYPWFQILQTTEGLFTLLRSIDGNDWLVVGTIDGTIAWEPTMVALVTGAAAGPGGTYGGENTLEVLTDTVTFTYNDPSPPPVESDVLQGAVRGGVANFH